MLNDCFTEINCFIFSSTIEMRFHPQLQSHTFLILNYQEFSHREKGVIQIKIKRGTLMINSVIKL